MWYYREECSNKNNNIVYLKPTFQGLQSSDGDLGKQMLEILKTMQKDNRDMKQMMGQKFAAMEQKYAAMEQKYAVMEQNDAARKQENEALRKDVDKLVSF